jgi:microcystin-dependent protein
MTGYIRQDVSNEIANGNVIDADIFDSEFDAIASAFNTSTGHTHDGSSAEGAPITVMGPSQDVSVTSTAVIPKTDNAYDLGSPSNEWKDLHIDGTANIDNLVADAGTVAGAAITTVSNTQTLTGKTINLASNTLVTTSAQLATALTDETGTGSVVFSGSPALTGTPTAPTAAAGTNTTQLATTAHVFAERTNTATLTNKTLTSPAVNTPTINSGAPLTANSTALNTAATHFVPSGGIIMWSGAIGAIPTGWLLCDGTNGTPDLRDRFVVGAGSGYAVGEQGGLGAVSLTTANLPAHTHTFSGTTGGHSNDHSHFLNLDTNVVGDHRHTILNQDNQGDFGGWTGNFLAKRNGAGGSENYNLNGTNTEPSVGLTNQTGNHAHNVQGNTAGTSSNHTHTFSGTTSSVGSGVAHENRPPYYALAYIMKS